LILGYWLNLKSSRKKSDRKSKELVERMEKEQKFAETQVNLAKQTGISLQILEKRVNEELDQIPYLFTIKKLNEAQVKLFNCRRIAIKNRFQYLFPKIEQLKFELHYLQANQKRERTIIIKEKVLELGTNVDRLFISDILESTNLDDEDLAISVLEEMIEKKEIYAEYFSASKSIAFDLQANVKEIDKLMGLYREWEKDEVKKKSE